MKPSSLLLILALLPNVVMAANLSCNSKEDKSDTRFTVSFYNNNTVAEVKHPDLGNHATLDCKPNGEGSLFCLEQGFEGSDNPMSINIAPDKVTKRLTGTIDVHPTMDKRITLADIVCE